MSQITVIATDSKAQSWDVVEGEVSAGLGDPRSCTLTVVDGPHVDMDRYLTVYRKVDDVNMRLGRFRPHQIQRSLGEARVTLIGMGAVADEQRAYVAESVTGDVRSTITSLLTGAVPDYPVSYSTSVLSGVTVTGWTWEERWKTCADLALLLNGRLTEGSNAFLVRSMTIGSPVHATVLESEKEIDRSLMYNSVTCIGSSPLSADVWYANYTDAASVARNGLRVSQPVEVKALSYAETYQAAQEWVRQHAGIGVKRTATIGPDSLLEPGDTVDVDGPGIVTDVKWPLAAAWTEIELAEA